MSSLNDWITLNVGGRCFTTTRMTLCTKEPESMLARMFSNSENDLNATGPIWSNCRDSNNAYLIDRSPRYFEPVLNYLRHGKVICDPSLSLEGILEEAKFFGLDHMAAIVEEKIARNVPKSDDAPLTRRDVVEALIRCRVADELRFQGVNLSGANLSNLDLRHINLKHANMQHADLSGANLSFSQMDQCCLYHAKLDGAQLSGVRLLRANLEGASLRGCNFEDPAGAKASMESANLKSANFEGSSMTGINLRVATLKHANMKNCVLHSAVLAGANLENCDLSGSDLQEANLRGANFKDAIFEPIVAPLHMSQMFG